MALMPPDNVPAPQPRGLRYGLFAVANGPLTLPDKGRGGGVIYEPETCGHAHTYPVECPGESPAEEKIFDELPDPIEAEPFVVYGSLTCGSAGKTQAQLEAAVRRNLASGEQSQAEAELAVLLEAASAGLGSTINIVSAVSQLEQWLYGIATADYGHIGYLHASPDVAAHAGDANLIVDEGSRKRTPYGTLWSIGGGYPPGTIYISGQVTVWRAADVSVPPLDQTLDRATNQYYTVAEREYAVAFDCVANSIDIDLIGG